MNPRVITVGILRAIGVIVAIAFVLWLLYMVQNVIIYLAIAAVLSLIGTPIVRFLRRSLKLNSTWAAIITILLFLFVIVGVIALFIPVIIHQSQNLSKIHFDDVRDNFNRLFEEVSSYFGIDKTTVIQGFQEGDFLSEFDFGIIPSFLNSILNNVGAAFAGLFAVIFITFFLLKDSRILIKSILTLSPRGTERRFLRAFNKIKHLLSRYFIGLILQVFIMFVFYTIILLVFGIDNALAIAVFCAVLNLVPFLGPLVGGIVILLLATTTYIDMDFQTVILPKLIYIFIFYAIAQLIDNFVIQPFVFGNSVKSHPLEIFLAIIIAGLLFGVIGMIVAIPVYTAIKVISFEFWSRYKIVQKLTKGY